MKNTKWLGLFFTVLLIFAVKVNQVNAEVVVGDQIDIYVGEGNQTDQSVAYDSINKRFLAVWYEGTEETATFYGQLVNVDGSLYGGRITIYQIAVDSTVGSPKIAFDLVNQRFLVVWGWVHLRQPEYIWVAETYGQFLNIDGSLSGNNFRISPDPFEIEIFKLLPQDIIFDTIGNRFFVLINSGDPAPYQLYGQFVTTNGPLGDLFQITNFTSGYGAWYAKVGYDSNNNRFLVAYGNGSDGDIYGRLLNADGAPYTEEFIISDTGEPGGGNNIASLPFDLFNNRFLAVFNRAWWLHSVEGQFINADGSLYGEPIIILTYQDSNGAIFDSVNKKFLVVGTYSGTWGQLLNTDGSLFGSSFLITNDWNPYPPVLAGESLSSGILAVCSVDLGYGTGREIVGKSLSYVNNPPVLNTIGDKEVYAGELLTFEVSGYDLEEDSLVITSPNLPQGATLVDHGNGTATFSWTPQDFVGAEAVINKKIINNNFSPAGQSQPLSKKYNVTFKISDGEFTDEETIVITVKSKRVRAIPYPR